MSPRLRSGLIGLSLGLVIATFSLVALPLVFHEPPLVSVAILGLYIAVRGWIDPRTRIDRVARRLEVVAVVSYLCLLAIDFGLAVLDGGAASRPRKHPVLSVRGMYRNDPVAGYGLTPNYRGVLDDGWVRAPVEINSRGDRDDEPSRTDTPGMRVLLVGDSFAFGYGLTREQTIERQVERLSNGAIDVYNTGVIGYSPSNIVARLRATDWWRGSTIVYLFFNNDLADFTFDHYGVLDGILTPRYREDGKPYSLLEARQAVARELRWSPQMEALQNTLTLATIRTRLRGLDVENVLDVWHDMYSSETVEGAFRKTLEMREVGAGRGADLVVVIIPTVNEARLQRYSAYTSSYIDALRQSGIEPIEVRAALAAADYFKSDPHLNPAGARKVAEILLRQLGSGGRVRPSPAAP